MHRGRDEDDPPQLLVELDQALKARGGEAEEAEPEGGLGGGKRREGEGLCWGGCVCVFASGRKEEGRRGGC